MYEFTPKIGLQNVKLIVYNVIMRRSALKDIDTWYEREISKPLIIRGARQVGKSTLVRLFCESKGIHLIEMNLEIERLSTVNKDDFSLQEVLDEIQFKKKTKIKNNSVIFFDEIQESPKLLKYLRYFYEQAPHLKIIAAGSLLEIALKTEDFSFPVGRVEFYHLGPMNFQEFLWATNNVFLDEKLLAFEFSEALHLEAIKALKHFFYVGGMPEVVKKFVETKSLIEIRPLQKQLIQSYQADFPKYNRRINVSRIERIFASLAHNIGEKIIYTKIDSESVSRDIKRVVELLIDARVILPCFHSAGNSPPLSGESDDRIYKTYFLDIGLLGAMLNIDLNEIEMEIGTSFNFKGKLAEQFVAQHLSYMNDASSPPSLYYYLRDKGSQKAEIDFLFDLNRNIVPIEVKASKSGHLKSLQLFCKDKKSRTAIKTSLKEFNKIENFIPGMTTLFEIPLYAINYINTNSFDE